MSEYIITSVQIKAYFININTKIIVFSHKQTASVTKPIRFGDKSSCVKSRNLLLHSDVQNEYNRLTDTDTHRAETHL